MDESALARVEKQRLELEANIAQLRKSLRHWQTLEIDYEGLKEEFLGLPEDSSPDQCFKAAQEFRPDLVDEKELREALKDSSSRPRTPSQLAQLFSKRVDYVVRNVETVRKQLSDAEKKRNALLLAQDPEHRDDAALPLAEITEELDEAGNVTSSKVQTPGSEAPALIDVLKKAGVDDLKQSGGTLTISKPGAESTENGPSETVASLPEKVVEAAVKPVDDGLAPSSASESFPTNPDDTEEEALLREEMLQYQNGLDEVGAIVAELDLEEGSDISYDEDDENLDVDSDVEMEDDYDDEESEDDAGKSKERLHISRGYRKQMEELQERLGLKNVGPSAELQFDPSIERFKARPPAAEMARKAALSRQHKVVKSSLKSSKGDDHQASASSKPQPKQKSKDKKVAFSSTLDIAPEAPNTNLSAHSPTSAKPSPQEPKGRPISNSVVERDLDSEVTGAVTPPSAPIMPSSSKQSRFKAARQAQPQTPMFNAPPMIFPTVNQSRTEPDDVPSVSPPSQLVSDIVVERPVTETATDPDDFSEEAHRREIAIEYSRMRVKKIQAQGGFVAQHDADDNFGEAIVPIAGDDEQPKKVSRFKAARLRE